MKDSRFSILLLLCLIALVAGACATVVPDRSLTETEIAHSQNTATPATINPISTPKPTADEIIPTTSAAAGDWTPSGDAGAFDADRAYGYVVEQVEFGPRIPGSEAHAAFVDWALQQFSDLGWEADVQETVVMGHTARNIIARRPGLNDMPIVILGAHYDSRLVADEDPDPALRSEPVPGANDGASGVAVLLELAQTLPEDRAANVWLVLFDLEDNGNLPGWDWSLGARGFVSELEVTPEFALIVDMIGDADLAIYKENNSDFTLNEEIWMQANALGYTQFIDIYKYSIIDDHLPFIQAGIPAVDLIDIEYDYYHTVADTPDKVSPASLDAVGETLLAWLEARY